MTYVPRYFSMITAMLRLFNFCQFFLNLFFLRHMLSCILALMFTNINLHLINVNEYQICSESNIPTVCFTILQFFLTLPIFSEFQFLSSPTLPEFAFSSSTISKTPKVILTLIFLHHKVGLRKIQARARNLQISSPVICLFLKTRESTIREKF